MLALTLFTGTVAVACVLGGLEGASGAPKARVPKDLWGLLSASRSMLYAISTSRFSFALSRGSAHNWEGTLDTGEIVQSVVNVVVRPPGGEGVPLP